MRQIHQILLKRFDNKAMMPVEVLLATENQDKIKSQIQILPLPQELPVLEVQLSKQERKKRLIQIEI